MCEREEAADGNAAAQIARVDAEYRAFLRARGPAFGAARRLLGLMLSGTATPEQIEAAAKACYFASGDLWDTAQRVTELRPK